MKQVVAWGDMDAYGHLNNVVYARYFESARATFFSKHAFWDDPGKPADEGVILTRQELKYRKQVRFPHTLEIQLTITKSGSRGFTMGCRMFNEQNELACEAEADILWINFKTGKPAMVPKEIREFKQ